MDTRDRIAQALYAAWVMEYNQTIQPFWSMLDDEGRRLWFLLADAVLAELKPELDELAGLRVFAAALRVFAVEATLFIKDGDV